MASNVWDCLVTYNTAKAKEIERDYHNNQSAILRVLDGYPHKGEYHGHQKGGAGDGNNEGAVANRKLAIEYLEEHKPPEVEDKPKPVSPEKHEDPNKSLARKEEKQAAKAEKKVDRQAVAHNLETALKNTTNKNAFHRNPKTGPIADLIKELAAIEKLTDKDNEVLLEKLGKKFSNVKSAI